MLTHEQMPLVDEFGRSIVIIDREEHAKHWCRAKRCEIYSRRLRVREELHAINVLEREVEQLEDELAREQRRAS
jgi:hypothetical protein